MAKEDKISQLVSKYAVRPPEKAADGTIKTARWETGIKALDVLTNGGFPKGKGINFGSEEGVGKTTMLIHAGLNQINQYNSKVVYIDTEGGATYDLLDGIGVNFDTVLYDKELNPKGKFYLFGASTVQEVSTICKVALEDPETSLVVVDSTTQVTDALALKEEDLGTSKNPVGESARMWSSVLKKLGALVNKSQATLVLINQARNDLSGFHVTMKPSGGKAAKHFATVEIWGMRRAYIGEGDVTKDKLGNNIKKGEAIGAYVQLTTLKNRLGFPFRSVDAYVYFGKGVSNKWSYRQWLQDFEIVDQATGEVRPVLQSGSYPSLKLPSGEYNTGADGKRVRGNEGAWTLIENNWNEIVQFVEDNGGFVTSINTELEHLDD